ncbi:hypothetical protein KUTeg_020937 [Tegillarca granosa]|uniref:UspA domain-containing protein n=1 Tax=Tegillarca granosa TaxID=220873 RepID=A0ABQ9EET3_TEGGR|nr:hypothetical protein KUTeg_020937 [Tegillarca granosa]
MVFENQESQIEGTIRSIHSSNVGKGILHTASEIGADVVILGSKGHSKLRRTLFGSVTDYNIRNY